MIEEMEEHIEALRELLGDFDFETHNDKGNPAHVLDAIMALESLHSHVTDLVP